MHAQKPLKAATTAALFATMSLALVSNSLPAADDTMVGAEEYETSCESCHGPNGKGDGIFKVFLKLKPADLTVLSKNNNGKYPFRRVYEIIDGRMSVKAHGDSVMPIWGRRYTAEANEQFSADVAEDIVRGRIAQLVYYVQSIQE